MNVLEAEHITKRYKNQVVLDDVCITLSEGKIYGFVGNNGSGKTTFMRIITGLCYPNSGTVKLFGEESIHKGHHGKIGALIETPIFNPDMSVYHNLLAYSFLHDGVNKNEVRDLLKTVGLDSFSNKAMKNFSIGMKQRYGIALALLGKPNFLILDEPLNGMDVQGMDDITNLLKSICREQNVTILVSSHLLARLDGFATDYIFIDYGKVIEEISAQQLNEKLTGSLEDYFRHLVSHKILGNA